MGQRLPGSAALVLVLVDGTPLLRPELQVFDAMLDGWAAQKASRNLAVEGVKHSLSVVSRFQEHSGEFPWAWTPAHFEEWTMDLRTVRGCALSTTRGYQAMVRMFLRYVCDSVYGWDRECEARFESFPIQIATPWNTARHRSEFEGRPERRSMTRAELGRLFEVSDDRVEQVARFGGKGYVSTYRDSVMIKATYGWDLRSIRRCRGRPITNPRRRGPARAHVGTTDSDSAPAIRRSTTPRGTRLRSTRQERPSQSARRSHRRSSRQVHAAWRSTLCGYADTLHTRSAYMSATATSPPAIGASASGQLLENT